VMVVCLLAHASCICSAEDPFGDPSINMHFALKLTDDFHGGYTTLPYRLLSEGNLGEEPFNGPRSEGSEDTISNFGPRRALRGQNSEWSMAPGLLSSRWLHHRKGGRPSQSAC
jgi:hypothetical protein